MSEKFFSSMSFCDVDGIGGKVSKLCLDSNSDLI